jgi:peptidoglycan/LPS O-acetylase OafA/YrhL
MIAGGKHSTEYRPDIDGLRALAVLAVVGFHAAPALVPGGFVGVDVFFVISGYLISGILLQSLARERFSLVDFYKRRIRRIFPALVVVLAAVWCLGWFVLFPDEFMRLGRYIAACAAFVSNIILWREAGYFDVTADLKPLLHLWSLAVEEQFYFVLPLFLFVTWRVRSQQLTFILAAAALSFAFNVAVVHSHPNSTYYSPLTRLWELAVGAALARRQLFPESRWPWEPLLSPGSPRVREILSIAGVALIGWSLWGLNRNTPFPGFWALPPVAGTMFVIAAGPGTWLNRTVLGHRAAVAIGLISYPLYLWHWPLLSFARIIGNDDPPPIALAVAVGLAFVLAFATYRLVEQPVRAIRHGAGVAVCLLAAITLCAGFGYASFSQTLVPRSAAYNIERYIRPGAERAYENTHLAHFSGASDPRVLAQGNADDRVLFIGDSDMEQYYPRIDKMLTDNPRGTRGVVFAAEGGCPPLPNVKSDHEPYCEGLVPAAMQLATDPHIESVVVGALWISYFVTSEALPLPWYYQDSTFKGSTALGTPGAQKALSAFESMIGRFTRNGKKVFIVLQIPSGEAIDPRFMIERSLTNLSFRIRVKSLPKAVEVSEFAWVDSRLREIARRTGATVIDPLESLCDATQCPTVTPEGEPIYQDAVHLRPSYVREHVRFLDPIVQLAASPH